MKIEFNCQQCGGSFVSNRPNAKFCSTLCFGAANHKPHPCNHCGKDTGSKARHVCDQCRETKQAGALKSRLAQIQAGTADEIPPSDPKHLRVYTLYKEGFGIGNIEKVTGINRKIVREILIKSGVYKPDPNRNGKAKKGTGEQSRILMAIRRKEKEQQAKELRLKMATCLKNLRKGIGVQRTCVDNGWSWQSVYQNLCKNKTYRLFRDRFEPSCDRQSTKRKSRTLSRRFKHESDFHEDLKSFLRLNGIPFEDEKEIGNGRARLDLVVNGIGYECKITTSLSDTHKAIGQILFYKTHSSTPVKLLIPDDIEIQKDALTVLDSVGIPVLNESSFKAMFTDGNVVPVSVKERAFTCKCCLLSGVRPSQSPSGGRRSYCVKCEPEINQYAFHYHLGRWMPRQPARDELFLAPPSGVS